MDTRDESIIITARMMVDELVRRVNAGVLDLDDYDVLVGKIREAVALCGWEREFIAWVNTKGVPSAD